MEPNPYPSLTSQLSKDSLLEGEFENQSTIDSIQTIPPKVRMREDRRKTIAEIRGRFHLQNTGFEGHFMKVDEPPSQEEPQIDINPQDIKKKKNMKFHEVYKPLEILGQGSFAVVKKIVKIETDKLYVAKVVRTRDQEYIDQLTREFNIIKKLQHDHIVKAEELFIDMESGNAQIVLEYCEGQTLQELIEEKIKLDEKWLVEIIRQIVTALDYLHSKGLCHRDITPANIIINEKNEAKLIDFTVSKVFKQDLWSPVEKPSATFRKKHLSLPPNFSCLMLTDTGTGAYKAPEVVKGVPYSHSVDMWSLGVVTFYALVGYRPFHSKNIKKLYELIINAKIPWNIDDWEHISYEAKIFVSSCLNKNPFIRLKSKEALHHPWIKGIKIGVEHEKNTAVKRFSPQVLRKKLINTKRVYHGSLTGEESGPG